MSRETDIFLNRIREKSAAAYNGGRFTFTDFLSLDEQNLLKGISRELYSLSFYGGAPDCERVVARFGDPEELGYEEDYPVTCIRVAPVSPKFARPLTHRDFLGSLMSLGIERASTGDIFVKDNAAYVFVLDKLAGYIADNLTEVGRVRVTAEICEPPSSELLFTLTEKTLNVASLRLDCLVSALFNLSRGKAEAFFDAKLVFVNGRESRKSDEPSPGDVVSVRRLGKFRMGEIEGRSKKDRLFVTVYKYE